MSLLVVALMVVGLGLLVYGAEWLVKGAARLARMAGISPLVVGLTVVAFGTSAPELAVSLKSAISGQSDLTLGNVIGSNIFNVLFILGASALVAPLLVSRQLVRFDVPVMVAVSVAGMLMALDGGISRLDGALLVGTLVVYTCILAWKSRRDTKAAAELDPELATDIKPTAREVLLDLGRVIGGLALLVIGSRWLVSGAVDLAQYFGVSELVIGLTIVAAGTSLPEVATSIMAAWRGEREIAVGNVVGSNTFNILCVLGFTALVKPIGVSPDLLKFDMPVMIAVAFACVPIFVTGRTISRSEGLLLLLSYVVYTITLIHFSRGHAWDHWALVAATAVIGVWLLVITIRMFTGKRTGTAPDGQI